MFRDRPTIDDAYRTFLKNVQNSILSERDEMVLHSDTEDLAEYYFSHNSFSPVEFDPDRGPTFEHKKEMRVVPAHQRDEPYRGEGDLRFEYESIVITLPLIPNDNLRDILSRTSSTFSLSGDPRVGIEDDALVFGFDMKGYGLKLDDNQVAAETNRVVSDVKQWIGWKNDHINRANPQLKENIRAFIEQRKAKLNEDTQSIASLVQKIDIPLKHKESPAVTRVKLDPKPLVSKVKPNPTMPEEYRLDRAKVIDIVSVIDNQGRQFEKTPKTYKDLDEESLRDIILVSLNSLFEGKATGETFSYKGKTDIYLNIDKGNILICECKIWGGPALYGATIDQLRGYLTWRDNFGVMITFVKLKHFSKVLGEAPHTVQGHLSYRSGFTQVNEHHFLSHHSVDGDEAKSVEIHHLFYNLYFA
jgi:hypothetical protein